MSINHNLPLQSLLVRLEQAGFSLDPSTQYKIQEVLQRLGRDYLDQPAQIRRLIGPIIANNPQEQMLFQEVFDSYWEEVLTLEEESSVFESEDYYVEEEIDEVAIKKAVKKRREWAYPVGLLALIAVFAGIFWVNSQEITDGPQHIEPDSDIFFSAPNSTPKDPDNAQTEFKSGHKISAHQDSSIAQSFSIGHLDHVYENEKKFISVLSESYPYDKHTFYWDLGDGNAANTANFYHTYKTGGFYEIKLFVDDQLVQSEWITVYPEYLSPKAQKQASLQAMTNQQNRIKWQIVLLAFLLIVGVESYLERYRKKMYQYAFEQEFQAKDHGQYKLDFPETSQKLKAEPEFYQLANRLRQRKLTGPEVLDVPTTLYETIRAGGFPIFAYAPTSKQSEYLILLDRSGPTDQQAKLFAQFVELLKAEEVSIQAYSYRNDPHICYNEQYPEGISLEILANRNPDHRLIIFSKGNYWIDIRNHKLKTWVEPLFGHWKQRIMLTPEDVKQWGKREDLLQEVFTLFPADLETQQGIIEALLGHEDELIDFQASLLARRVVDEPLKDYDFNKVEDLHDYLGESLFEWLMATMVYPQPGWEMTLKIGENLETEGLVMADGSKLVTYDNLLKLSTIPWLQEAEVPTSLRKELLAELDPEVEEIARHAVLELLDEVKATPSTPAFTKKRIQQTVQQAALEPQNKKLQNKLKYLWQNDLLSSSAKNSLKKEIKPSLLERLGGALPYQAVFYVLLPLLGLGYVGYQVHTHSTGEVFERYFRPFPMGEGMEIDEFYVENYHNGKYGQVHYDWDRSLSKYQVMADIATGRAETQIPMTKRDRENYDRMCFLFAFYSMNSFLAEDKFELINKLQVLTNISDHSLHWYQVIQSLKSSDEVTPWNLIGFLDSENPYYYQFLKLQTEMSSFWHWY